MIPLASINEHVADLYHDEGKLLAEAFGGAGAVPEFLRKAAAAPDLDALPDEDFALVVYDGGKCVRKLAMHDSEHAAISLIYLCKQEAELPEAAVKTAAARLHRRLAEFGVESGLPDSGASAHAGVLRATQLLPRVRVISEDNVLKVAEAETPLPPEALASLIQRTTLRKLGSAHPEAYDGAIVRFGLATTQADAVRLVDTADKLAGRYALPSHIESAESCVEAAIKMAKAPESPRGGASANMLIRRILDRRPELIQLLGDKVFQQLLDDPATVIASLPEPSRNRVERVLR